MSDNYRLIEGDGIITNLFYFLWKKKTDTGTLQAPPSAPEGSVPMPWEEGKGNHHVHFSPEFLLPSTVMYEHNYPKAWYYPHANGKGVWDLERRLGKDIDSASILKNFCPRSAAALEQYRVDEHNTTTAPAAASGGGGGAGGAPATAASGGSGGGGTAAGMLPAHLAKFEEQDLVAAYFSTAKSTSAHRSASSRPGSTTNSPTHGPSAGRSGAASFEDDVDEPRTVVEYMNEPQLRDFLLRRTKREDGFLQRWVWPNGKHNNVLQAVWTPHMCLVTRRTNRHAVRDAREAMYDRAVTFEGPSHLSTESAVAAHIEWQIGRFCTDMVAYMFAEHHVPVRRMVVHFKVDWNSHIWFLWASSVRVQDKAQLNLTVKYVARLDVEGAGAEEEGGHGGATAPGGANNGGGGGRRGHRDARAKFIAQQAPEMKQLIRRVDGERHLTQIHFPRPPSMGPIGDMYTWGSLMDPLDTCTPQRKKKKKSKQRHATVGGSAPASKRASPRGSVQLQITPTTSRKKSNALGHPLQPLELPSARGSLVAEGSPAPSSNPNDHGEPKRKKSLRRKSHRGGSPHSPSNTRTPRFDEMLRTLRSTNRLYTAEQRQRASHTDAGEAQRALQDAAAALFGPQRQRRHASVLWAMLRHVVRTGCLRTNMALLDAVEFFHLARYSVYSHFLTSEDALTIQVPLTLGCGVPSREGTWVPLAKTLAAIGGLEVQEIFDEANTEVKSRPLVPQRPSSSRRRQSSVPRCPLATTNATDATIAGHEVVGTPTASGAASEGLPPPSAIGGPTAGGVTPSGLAPQPDAHLTSPPPAAPHARVSAAPSLGDASMRSRSCVVVPSNGGKLLTTASPIRQSQSAAFVAPPASTASSTDVPVVLKQEKRHTVALRVVAAHKPVADVDALLGRHTAEDISPLAAASLWQLLTWRWVFLRRPVPEAFVFGDLSGPASDDAYDTGAEELDAGSNDDANSCEDDGIAPPMMMAQQ